ncbi:MAG: cell division protein FtsA [Patescibacteria group bacterium]
MSKTNKIYDDLVAGVDIGSNNIRLVVGQVGQNMADNHNVLKIISAVEVPSEGIQKGQITSIEDLVSTVSGAIEKTEKIIGMPVEHVWVGVSGTQIISQDSKGIVSVSRNDGEITIEDIERAVESAKSISTPTLNHEIIHVLPKSYIVDGQTGIKDPVGMTGKRLEVETKIIHTVSSYLKNLSRVIYRAGLDIDDFVLSILAAGDAVTNNQQKDLGSVVINIGGPTTSVLVYEDGEVIHSAVIPIGSSYVTNDIALGLKTSIDIAERIKIEHGNCNSRDVGKKDFIDLKDYGAEKEEYVSKYLVSQIIEARMSEIFEKVDKELKQVQKNAMLPAGAILIGGGAKINGIIDMAKNILALPAQKGYITNIESISDKINDIAFCSAIGLVKWGFVLSQNNVQKKNNFKVVDKFLSKSKKIFKTLIP